MLANLSRANEYQAELRMEAERRRLVRKARATVVAAGRGHLALAGTSVLAAGRRGRR
ncbi:hypothetical protein GHK86_18495 [Acidimicrobiaceae bacterium USS-CC1]|uniref:Uncharacterized protein n=1 Tax=Acidiferrimicrobium australe TaxID=2664430 RepID=A0ABW9QXV3_9ACTN|nr:hypothetical protein [Acidiferrimicrobium australe]